MTSSENDEKVVLSYQNGNQEALKKLIDRYTTPLYNFVARLANRNDAPDIVQEVFIKVWKNINHFDETRASFKTWIFTITKNTTTDFVRKRKILSFSDLDKDNDEDVDSFAENIPDETLLPELALQKLEDGQFLNKILEKLPRNYQEILVLHYQEEMTFAEIGKILNKPLNTVKSQHRRAILKLKELLG